LQIKMFIRLKALCLVESSLTLSTSLRYNSIATGDKINGDTINGDKKKHSWGIFDFAGSKKK